MPRARWREPGLVAIFCVFFFFYGLSGVGLVGADEPRYAQVAREMLARGNWVTPTLFGHPWLEKPPLYYWGAMVSYWLLGVSDWAARLPSAVLATGMIFAVFFFVRRFRPGAELTAALATCSAVAVAAFARGASTDMPLAATFTVAMLAWFGWYASAKKRWLAVFYLFLALGMLAKGPVAPGLAALIIIAFAALRREWSVIPRSLWPWGVALFCAAGLPWYALAEWRNPQFFTEFILRQNLARFSTDLYRHPHPWWYYAVVLVLALFPWSVFAIAGAAEGVRLSAGRVREPGPMQPERQALAAYLLAWALVPVIFFSLSQSKLTGYILPAVPAWLMLGALYIHRRSEQPRPLPAGIMALHALWLGLILGLAEMAAGPILHPQPELRVSAAAVRIGLAIAVATVGFAVLCLRTGSEELLRFATLLPLVLAAGFVLKVMMPAIDAAESGRPLAAQLAHYPRGATIVALDLHRGVQFGIAFYRNQPVPALQQVRNSTAPFLLVAPMSQAATVERTLAAVEVGEYGPQQLGLWWVTPKRQPPITLSVPPLGAGSGAH